MVEGQFLVEDLPWKASEALSVRNTKRRDPAWCDTSLVVVELTD